MRNSLFFILILIFSYSCKKDEGIQINKSGHFLSKIISNNRVEEAYNYDESGNLVGIDLFSPINGFSKPYKLEFEYYSNGLIQKWTRIDTSGQTVMYELFEYNNLNKVIKRTNYYLNKINSKFEANVSATFDYSDNKIVIQNYNYGMKSPVNFELELDQFKNNITVIRSYINKSLTNISLFAYDDKINPYNDLKLPLPFNQHNFIPSAAYFSKNNVIRESSILIKPDSAIIDTVFSSCYNLHYQYDELGYPIKIIIGENNNINFEYIDIK